MANIVDTIWQHRAFLVGSCAQKLVFIVRSKTFIVIVLPDFADLRGYSLGVCPGKLQSTTCNIVEMELRTAKSHDD